MAPVSILSWGGVGDTLRNISLVPHDLLWRRFGIRSRVVYKHWRRIGSLPRANCPGPDVIESFVWRVPSLYWAGEVENHTGAGRYVNAALRAAIKLLTGRPRYFPFEIRLTDKERAALPAQTHKRRIAVQTHLSGMATKEWGLENWRRYLQMLLARFPDAEIHLFDTDPRIAELRIDGRIDTTERFNIMQSIVLLERCDLLVAIDSWTKYVAAWSRIPQLIIVPDQRSEYAALTADRLIAREFAGMYGEKNTDVIGLSTDARQPRFTLGSISDLDPAELLARTAALLDRLVR